MTRKTKQDKAARNRYSREYKSEALAQPEKLGVAAAAQQLGLRESQIYAWRSQARQHFDRGEAEQRLTTENARLKRQLAEQAEELAILKKAAAYFAKHQ